MLPSTYGTAWAREKGDFGAEYLACVYPLPMPHPQRCRHQRRVRGRVVGWTFGDFVEGAFLWAGDEGINLRAEIRVDDYYRLTFANSREEEFALALTMADDYSDLDRLEAFTQAFRFNPKLSVNDTPAHLQPDAIISQLRLLIARAVQDGFAVQVANYFDSEVLAQADDVSLMSDVVILTAKCYGFEEAVNLT